MSYLSLESHHHYHHREEEEREREREREKVCDKSERNNAHVLLRTIAQRAQSTTEEEQQQMQKCMQERAL